MISFGYIFHAFVTCCNQLLCPSLYMQVMTVLITTILYTMQFLTSFTPGISSKAIVSGEPMLANFFTKYGNNKWTDRSSGISYTCAKILQVHSHKIADDKIFVANPAIYTSCLSFSKISFAYYRKYFKMTPQAVIQHLTLN